MDKLMENSKDFIKKYSTDVDNTNYLYNKGKKTHSSLVG